MRGYIDPGAFFTSCSLHARYYHAIVWDKSLAWNEHQVHPPCSRVFFLLVQFLGHKSTRRRRWPLAAAMMTGDEYHEPRAEQAVYIHEMCDGCDYGRACMASLSAVCTLIDTHPSSQLVPQQRVPKLFIVFRRLHIYSRTRSIVVEAGLGARGPRAVFFSFVESARAVMERLSSLRRRAYCITLVMSDGWRVHAPLRLDFFRPHRKAQGTKLPFAPVPGSSRDTPLSCVIAYF